MSCTSFLLFIECFSIITISSKTNLINNIRIQPFYEFYTHHVTLLSIYSQIAHISGCTIQGSACQSSKSHLLFLLLSADWLMSRLLFPDWLLIGGHTLEATTRLCFIALFTFIQKVLFIYLTLITVADLVFE